MADGTCSIDGCDRAIRVKSRGWCNSHYSLWQRYGDPQAAIHGPWWPEVCRIEGCDRPHSGRGWCGIHYSRWERTGDPGADVPIVTRRKSIPDGQCSADGCDKAADRKRSTLDLCRAHLSRLERTGDLHVAAPVREHGADANDITYHSFHTRLRKARGSARDRQCVRCDRTAEHWAYVHGQDPCEFDSYVPMCVSCHAKYDRNPAVRLDSTYMGGPAAWPGRRPA